MKKYTATETDMQEYARLVGIIAALDLQREQAVKAVAAWEEAHAEEIPDEGPWECPP